MNILQLCTLSGLAVIAEAATAAPAEVSYSELCETHSDIDDKLACYREAVHELEQGTEADTGGTVAETDSPPRRVAAPDPQQAGLDRGVPRAPAERMPSAAERMPSAAERMRPVATTLPPETPSGRAEDDGEGRYAVAEVRRSRQGKLTVVLQNGEVWRQLDSDGTRVPLPDETGGLMAEIKKGVLGSERMQLIGSGRAFRVRRVR